MTEQKLDEIIEILLRIEQKIKSQSNPETANFNDNRPLIGRHGEFNPTKKQRDFRRRIELMNRMEKTQFLSAIKNYVLEFKASKKKGPYPKFKFNPITLKYIDEEIAKAGAPFYKGLRAITESFVKGVESEAEKLTEN